MEVGTRSHPTNHVILNLFQDLWRLGIFNLNGYIPKLIQDTDTFRYIGDPRKVGRRTCDEKNLEYTHSAF